MTEFDSPRPDMKIYSWNVYCFNRQMPALAKRIEKLDFDVLCLQEVTPALLEELKKMPFYLTYRVDRLLLLKREKPQYNYVAILSKEPHISTGGIEFSDHLLPLHTRLFIWAMSRFRWSLIIERGALYADFTSGARKLRVFSVHLTLWNPENREKEFAAIVEHIESDMPTIVCGDFNVIDHGPFKLLNWLLGGPFLAGMPWFPERNLFEERFEKAGLRNVLRSRITHPFSKSQLDHILVSKNIEVEEARVEPERTGSDHCLVAATLRL